MENTNSQKETGTNNELPDGEKIEYTCYSARNCQGKVLNHKDRHNCIRSGGKSWSDGNNCYNL